MQQTTIWCNLYAGTIMITPFIPENVSVFKSLVLKHWMFVLQWITSWKRSSFSLMFRCYHSLQAGNFPLAELRMWTLPAPLQSKSTQLLQTWWQFQLLGFIPKQHKLQQPSTKSTYGCVLNYRSTGTAPIDHLHNYFNDKDPPMSGNQSWPRHKFGEPSPEWTLSAPMRPNQQGYTRPRSIMADVGYILSPKKDTGTKVSPPEYTGWESPVTALYRSGPEKSPEINVWT